MKLTIPNQLTILRIILTPVFLLFFVSDSMDYKLIGTIIFFIAAATDWYDGYVARRFNVITRWGQFMDPLADKILVSSALFVFAYLKILPYWIIILIIIRDFLITFLRMYALKNSKSIVTNHLAKWKTFLQMLAVFGLLIYLNFKQADIYHLSELPPPLDHWVIILFLAIALITVITGVQYIIENRAHLRELLRRSLKFVRR